MKNIVCPISASRVPEHLPRVTALFVISLLSFYLFTGSLVVLVYLLIDFIVRGAGYSQYSLLHIASRELSKSIKLKSELIDTAPKLFAARLGTVMMAIAILFELFSLPVVSYSIAIMVGVFATLECVLNFCVGCYVYSLIVLPAFRNRV